MTSSLTCPQLQFVIWPKKPFPLMRLPPEIRHKIFEHLLPGHQAFFLTATRYAPYGHPIIADGMCSSSLPALLRVSRLVREQFKPLFYGNNTFAITIDNSRELYWALRMLDEIFPPNSINKIDTFSLIHDLRFRVGNNLMLDVRSHKDRTAMYGKWFCSCDLSYFKDYFRNRMIAAYEFTGPLNNFYKDSGEAQHEVLKVLQRIAPRKGGKLIQRIESRAEGKVVRKLKPSDGGKGLDVEIVRDLLQAVFKESALDKAALKREFTVWTPW